MKPAVMDVNCQLFWLMPEQLLTTPPPGQITECGLSSCAPVQQGEPSRTMWTAIDGEHRL
nr:hypothetical protein OG781_38670 [Streptomyces sp. NBC_00830]